MEKMPTLEAPFHLPAGSISTPHGSHLQPTASLAKLGLPISIPLSIFLSSTIRATSHSSERFSP